MLVLKKLYAKIYLKLVVEITTAWHNSHLTRFLSDSVRPHVHLERLPYPDLSIYKRIIGG